MAKNQHHLLKNQKMALWIKKLLINVDLNLNINVA